MSYAQLTADEVRLLCAVARNTLPHQELTASPHALRALVDAGLVGRTRSMENALPVMLTDRGRNWLAIYRGYAE